MEMKTVRGKIIKELLRDFEGTLSQGEDAREIYDEILSMVSRMEEEIAEMEEKFYLEQAKEDKLVKIEYKLAKIKNIDSNIALLKRINRLFNKINLASYMTTEKFDIILPALLRTIRENELPVNVYYNGINFNHDGNFASVDPGYHGSCATITVILDDHTYFYYHTDCKYDIGDDIVSLERELSWAIQSHVYPYPDGNQ